MMRRAVKLYEALATDEPTKTVYRRRAAATYYLMGILSQSNKQPGSAEQEYASAIKQCRLALPHDEHGEIANDLAWYLVDCPALALREPAQAVRLARQAIARGPEMGEYWNTLGVALYRTGEFEPALNALNRSMELRSGGDAADFFFLAMAQERLGGRKQARTWFDKAKEWMDKHSPHGEADLRYQAEAKEVLGIKE
jgi:tetratricopeptide (TPR) repeat protein